MPRKLFPVKGPSGHQSPRCNVNVEESAGVTASVNGVSVRTPPKPHKIKKTKTKTPKTD